MNIKSIVLNGSFFVLAMSVPGLSQANFVTNGSFESYTGGYNGSPSKLSSTPQTNYTVLTGWNLITNLATQDPIAALFAPGTAETTGSYLPNDNGGLTFWGTANGGNNVIPASSPDGGNFLALDGAPAYQVGISQTLSNLTIGQTYAVSFYWAGAQNYGFSGSNTEAIQVSFGASTQETSVYNNPSHGFSGWMNQTFLFKADSTSDLIKFIAIGTPNGAPPFSLLDGVQVNVVPEPASIMLMGISIIGFVTYRRCRKKIVSH